MNVTKRNGQSEKLNIDKIHKVVEWAIEGLAGTSLSEIEMKAQLNFFDGIKTSDIHDLIIGAAKDLISENEPNYSKVAARLLSYKLRKDVWGGKNPPKLYDLVLKNVERGVYDPILLEWYTEDDFHKVDEFIDHDRDEMFEYAGLKQLSEKYLAQNRSTREVYETPQFAYALVSMVLFSQDGDNGDRRKLVKDAYDAFSKHKINISTPIMAGARTRTRSFSSCCLITVDDTKHSLFASNTAIGMATCDKYGIGIDLSKLRGINAPIRGGETLHTGVVPWLKMYQSTIHSCQQGGARRGAGTVTFPIFHWEIEDIVQLKDNTRMEANSVRSLDYAISISRIFWKRYLEDGNITLFSSHESRELFDKFGTPEFDEIYLKEEKKKTKFKKKVKARELIHLLCKQRANTGRIYITNIDEANKYSSWDSDVPIQMSNLCQEIFHPVKPITNNPDDGEIGVCVLSAVNMLNITSDADHEISCRIVVRMLDNLIGVQEYFHPAAERFAKNKRSIGIGISNLAGWLASHGFSHTSPESPQLINDFMEQQQYLLLKASCDLAKERGRCKDFDHSKYASGILPFERYNTNVDEFVDPGLGQDWESLRAEIQEHGLRNCTLSAQMPCEASSAIQGSTNGQEPIRSLLTFKTSKTSSLPILAPSIKKWKNKYTLAFDMDSNEGIIKCVAALTKWLDMGSSGNLYYPDGDRKMSTMVKDLLMATKYGWRSFYYDNTNDGDKQSAGEEAGCAGGACSL